MKTETLQLEHTETLLDVVFGVVIAVALTDLPKLVTAAIGTPSTSAVVDTALLSSSLVFAAFYWLEVRHFIAEQHRFNIAVGLADESQADSGVPVNLAGVLIGTLFMMTVASGILTFSRFQTYREFLIASALFWAADLGGSVVLKGSYRKFAADIRERRPAFREEHAWYLGHMESPFFLLYGGLNVAFFLGIVAVDRLFPNDEVRLWISLVILCFTLFRHLIWRSRIYVWYRTRQSRSAA